MVGCGEDIDELPSTKNGDTLGETLNICKILSTHNLENGALIMYNLKREKIGPIAQILRDFR
jgi:hypothetical protein